MGSSTELLRETSPAGHPGPRPALAWGAWTTCSLIWGSTFLFISLGNDALAPVWAASLRLALAAVLLTLIARLLRHPFPRGRALRAALAYGFLQFGVNFPLLYWGEKTFPSGLTAVLYATIPLSTALMTAALRMERLTPLKLAGAGVALAGVALLFSDQLWRPRGAGAGPGHLRRRHVRGLVGRDPQARAAPVAPVVQRGGRGRGPRGLPHRELRHRRATSIPGPLRRSGSRCSTSRSPARSEPSCSSPGSSTTGR